MDKNRVLALKVLKGLVPVLLLAFPLAALFWAVSPNPGHAQDPEEVLLYQDDFDDGEAQGWSLQSAGEGEVGWVVEDGMLRGREHFWAVYEEGNWFNTRLALTVYLGNPYVDAYYEGLHISLRVGDTGRYFVALHPNRVALVRQQGFGASPSLETIGQHDRAFDPGIQLGVSISAYEGHLLVVIDGVTEFEWDDPAPLPAGNIALETLDGGYARVDDVRVYGPPPAPRGVEPPIVEGVEPRQIQRGSQVELNIFGGNFAPEAGVEIGGEGVPVRQVEFVNAGHLLALVEVWDDAPLGWREVFVINPGGQAGGHERAVEVIEGEHPPSPVRTALFGLEPREVEQGSEVELTLLGVNLPREASLLVHGGGVEVHEPRFLDASRLIVRVTVHADAEPGPRLVELSSAGEMLELPDGLIVVERVSATELPPPPPPPSPISPTATRAGEGVGGGEPRPVPDWVWAGATVLLSGASFAVGRTLSVKSKLTWSKARAQWNVEAQKDLPEARHPCQWTCQAKISGDLFDLWQVSKIKLTPALQPKGRKLPSKQVTGDDLKPVNQLKNIANMIHREDHIRLHLAPVVDALLAQVRAWEQEGQTPPSIRVEAILETQINAQFGLYHCKQTAGGLSWGKPLVTWKNKLNQPQGEFLGIVRGPTAGEPDFAARARRELEACLLELVSVARFRL